MEAATLVGSREINDCYKMPMISIAYCLAQYFKLRSGRAKKCDRWAQYGYAVASYVYQDVDADIYVPEPRFGREFSPYPDPWECVVTDKAILEEARSIAASIHPNWYGCGYYAQMLHTRNVFQIMGSMIDDPSKLCIYAAFEDGGEVAGGTRTAVMLARKFNVPSLNICKYKASGVRSFLKEFGIDFDYKHAKNEFIQHESRLPRYREFRLV